MNEILLITTCVIVIAFIGYLLATSKKNNSSGNEVLSTQLSNLMERFVKLEEAAKNMNTMQSSIDSTFKNFQGMLNDRQERGAFSEVELEKLLKDRLPKQYLKFQETLSNNKRVDCLIDFGDANSRICIDSKFVLENFKNYVAAENDEEIKKFKKLFEEDVMKNVKKISEDYIISGETAPHAIMFIRSESVYRSIIDSEIDLMQKAREKNVLIVSPSYLWGLLNTLRVFLKDSEMTKKAQLIIKEIGLIGKDIGRLVERTEDVEKKFNLVADQFRNIKVSAEKIQRRAEKIEEIEGINIERIEKDKE
ncbi:MAG: DNA recombination protein RmuC [Proteobacteria bacterium]|jgi:DNA recombination protein RmuC|nr:DNA recombination protein RmuC [Pseudomonadota bacterium]MDA0971636.1 DNA recombination protein RmuC [Pseudomonadota bacterium]MDA0996505.1 DNA recombination protein RmuC [Pseudomonadota bacterium]